MRKQIVSSHGGVTIVELLIGIGIIGIISSIVITAISPKIQFTAARDAWRKAMAREIHSAITLYTDWNNGPPPAGILAGKCQKRPICRQGMGGQADCVDLDEIIDANFIVDWPVDVAEGSGALTGFTVYTDANAFFTTVEASYLGVSGYAVDEARGSRTTFVPGCPCYTCGCLADSVYPMSAEDGPIFALNQGGMLYTVNNLFRTVTVIDMGIDSLVTTIPVGQNPVHAVIVGGNLYVLNRDDNNISIISKSSNTVTTVTGMSNPGKSILVGTKLYVWNPTANAIKVIETAAGPTYNTIVKTFSGLFQGGAFVLNGSFLYALTGTTYIYKINTSTDTIDATYTDVGANPVFGIVVGTKLYTMNYSGNSISIIDTTTDTPTTTAIALSGSPIYATTNTNGSK